MARMKKNKTPDDNKFDVRRVASDTENTSKGKLNAKGKQAVDALNKASATNKSK